MGLRNTWEHFEDLKKMLHNYSRQEAISRSYLTYNEVKVQDTTVTTLEILKGQECMFDFTELRVILNICMPQIES